MMLFNLFRKNYQNILLTFLGLSLIWIVWIIAYYSVNNVYVIPNFNQTMKEIFDEFSSNTFWVAFSWTFFRTIIAFVVSYILSLIFLIITFNNLIAKNLLNPCLAILKTIPIAAAVLIILIWTNYFIAPIIVIFLIIFPIIYHRFNLIYEKIHADIYKINLIFKLSRKSIILIYFKQSTPEIFKHIGNDFSLIFKIMISAEILANTSKSIGGLIQNSKDFVNMPKLMGLTIIAILFSTLINVIISFTLKITYFKKNKWFYEK